MVSPSKVFALEIPSNKTIWVGAYADSREDLHKEFDDVGGCNHIEDRTEVPETSTRRVEDKVCRICEGMDAIAGESVQVQDFSRRKIVSRSCVKVQTSCLAAKWNIV